MDNRIAVITGAGSGIGRSTALALAAKGVRMILNGRDMQKLKLVEEEANSIAKALVAIPVSGDVADITVTGACIDASRHHWHTAPDIFVACAGRGLPGTLVNSDISGWDDLINTNVKGLMYQLSSIAKVMLEMAAGERDYIKAPMDIVVIGSSIGRNVSPFNSVYGATKFAAHGLTEALRRQLGPQGIRVTLIEPGIVSTGFQEAAGYSKEWFEAYAKEIGPVLEAGDIADVITFLLQLPGNVHLDNISIRPTRQAYP
jgi:NADP-dependent 3-hydroxy acid dehydrogenase YdfG